MTRVDGVDLSAPPRVLAELSSILSLPHLVAVADHLIRRRRPLSTIEQLAERLEVGDRLVRSPRLRRAIELADERSESPAESILRVILTMAGIPPTATNLEVTAVGFHYRIDLAYVDERVAVEYQGAHHLDPAMRRSDMTRRTHLEVERWTVVELNSDHLGDARLVVAVVRAALGRSRR